VVFTKKLIGCVFSGGGVSGLTIDSLLVFLDDIRNTKQVPAICSLKTNELAYGVYEAGISSLGKSVLYYPEKPKIEMVPGFISLEERHRNEVFYGPKRKRDPLIITTDVALSTKDIPITNKKMGNFLVLSSGEKQSREKIIEALLGFNYDPVETVYDPKTFCSRGDIVDIFPPYFVYPVRLSFNFDTIDKVSFFDPASQLSTKNLNKTIIKGPVVGPQDINNIDLIGLFPGSAVLKIIRQKKTYSLFGRGDTTNPFDIKASVVSLNKRTKTQKVLELQKTIDENKNLRLFFSGKKKDIETISGVAGVHGKTITQKINKGFFSHKVNSLVVSANDFLNKQTHVEKWLPQEKKEKKLVTLQSMAGLENGSFLVHKKFGVGIYRGMVTQLQPVGSREAIKVEYQDGAVVFVSVENMGVLHRHLGTKGDPAVSSLGSKKWNQEVIKAKKAVHLVVKDLINTYSKKQNPRAFTYKTDDELEGALAASFSFTETPDQTNAINDVLGDMLSPCPMDRLICGDVGFGKTEVALRAIMRAVISKKGCMFLCPTTILADQHYITCKERLESLGVRVALLSRFKTKKEQRVVLEKTASGLVDLLIGTHRLLSPDVIFPSLGLLVVDEEQRFGVRHKEKMRTLQSSLDVITLSATPIPRTLQQSTSGLRNISRIQTPPKSRKPINTEVRFFDWDLISFYIENELDNEGQVYFVHNDIESMSFISEKISFLFPSLVVVLAHGRLPSKELEKRVLSFFDGGIDVLVCTSIIESGLDVTNSNCIIINNAQNFGLSQLYQMRGRVGRGGRQARCLLLVPKKEINKTAHRRLKTIEKYTSLGSGYDISMKDLEIRGSGSLFGYEQSGHISSVGFEMYCELLKNEVNAALDKTEDQRLPHVHLEADALIPDFYIKSQSQRLEFYDRLSHNDVSVLKIDAIIEELKDRFGNPPQETKNLTALARIRALYKNTSVVHVEANLGFATVEFDDIKPFQSAGVMVSQITKWAVKNNFKFSFSKTQRQNLLFSFFYKDLGVGLAGVCRFAKLF